MRWLFSLLCVCSIFVMAQAEQTASPLSDEQRDVVTQWLALGEPERRPAANLPLPAQLTREQADAVRDAIWSLYIERPRAKAELDVFGPLPPNLTDLVAQAEGGRVNVNIQARAVQLGEHVMPFVVIRRESDAPPETGRALYICMHGGGGHQVESPHGWDVNTREWQVQTRFAIGLYPAEGVFFVPRMADDRLGRWQHAHNQDAFDRVIEHAIAHWGVDPNRVYMLGISEGGYGVNRLTPFMPDRFAAVNAMAAGEAMHCTPANLRNVPTRTDIGEGDTMFDRIKLARAYHARLDELHEAEPEGYINELAVQDGRGHGIDYRPGIPWIIQYTRNAYPKRIVWINRELHGRRREHFYWLACTGELPGKARIIADLDREANTITITAEELVKSENGYETHPTEDKPVEAQPLKGATLRIMLNDTMLDLDKPVTITCNGKTVHKGKVARSAGTLLQTLAERGDPTYAFPAQVVVELK